MSEAYVVDTYVKPAVLERIDPQQFGAVNLRMTFRNRSCAGSWISLRIEGKR